MFKLYEKYEVNRNLLKCDLLRYSPSKVSTIDTANSQIYINIPREDSDLSLLITYLHLNFDVLHAATNNRCEDNNDIKSIYLNPIALFSNYKLIASSGIHSEDISHAHVVSTLYNLITSARVTDDLSIGFERNRGRRQRKLTNYKTQKGKFHLRFMLKDVFGFCQCQEKGTFGFGYKLTLTRNTDNAVLNKNNAIKKARIKFNAIEWYVSHYTPSIVKKAMFSEQFLSKTHTELQYIKRFFFMKEKKFKIFGFLN